MGLFASMHSGVDVIRDMPPFRAMRKAAFDRRFEGNIPAHLFRGVFDTFDAAAAAAPDSLPLGYDNDASSNLYLQRLHIDEYDYPAMFWIAQSMTEGLRTIVDLGGSVGIKYFAFGRVMAFPADLVWRVIEVPAVVERGRRLAVDKGASRSLEFSVHLADADGVDVVFASGSLQYLPQTLAQMLTSMTRKPRRIIVNTTPSHPSRSFFTLNSIGTAYCPYRVQSHEDFVTDVTREGFVLRDQWLNRGKGMFLPFESGASVDHYSGFCFDAVPAIRDDKVTSR